ncbi:hypothetical protein INT43_003965 [Umbelopsis isabellina]|uniref:ethanolamine kinase n=1 Tax=Mortierella isabellina TaxID=91625 RepID=A0A8H7PU70_MORIS|nr:hypothetical protein INT43_003965 [Umbelopsis isabellina]
MPPLTKTPQPNLSGPLNGSTNYQSLESLIHSYPYLDVEVSSSNLFEGAWKVVSSIFTTWKQEDIKFHQCKDGITNQLVKVTHTPNNMSVLVRAYGKGSELIIDRKQELINIITLSSQNLCPPLYARFVNGLVYGFIDGTVSTVEDMFDSRKANLIATRLARWHKVKPLGDSDPNSHENTKLWSTMRKWLQSVPSRYEDPKTQETFAKSVSMQKLDDELNFLEKTLNRLNSPIVFSHNDLLYGNIIYSNNMESASFIDYEYGMMAPRGFDIGNHFNEYAGFECDYNNYPDKSYQIKWFEWYLTASQGSAPSSEELEALYQEVDHYSLASHLYWGLWALCQAMVSDIDFSYMDYAVMRFAEYEKRKSEVFGGV